MEEQFDYKKFKREAKARELKEKLVNAKNKTMDFVVSNKEMLVVAVPAAITGISTIAKIVGRNVYQRNEIKSKELQCYDRSIGHYLRLNRKLNGREWTEVERRKKSGENLTEIFASMGVLRR